MTDREWQTCCDIDTMLVCVDDRVDRRALGLFGCACCRRVWHLLDERSRHAVEVRESFERGEATEADWREAYWPAAAARHDARAPFRSIADVDERAPEVAAAWAAGAAENASRGNYRVASAFAAKSVACLSPSEWDSRYATERADQCALLRHFIASHTTQF